MTPDLVARCKELISRGRALASQIQYDEYGHANFWFRGKDVPELQAWIASVVNFFRLCATPDTYFMQEANRVVQDKNLSGGVPFSAAQKLIGLLESIAEEMDRGLMRKAEYIFVASTFDDFLDHAAEYHKSDKKTESSVLVSAVFEDAIRRFANKADVQQTGRSLDAVIDALVKKGSITPVKAKRWKSYASVRNSALHAQWHDFDIRDVGEMIKGTREIIESL
jgi:hypothetical protein